jgi:molybdopterin synthase sulfur carrier subunit
MKVYVPTPLRSYTGQQGLVEAGGSTLGELLWELDRHYPGFHFRIITEQDGIREHIKLFVNREQQRDLAAQLQPTDEIHIICALSGG